MMVRHLHTAILFPMMVGEGGFELTKGPAPSDSYICTPHWYNVSVVESGFRFCFQYTSTCNIMNIYSIL